MSKAEFRMLGPSDARKLLEMNTHNRRLNESNVMVWAQEMEEGRWRSNGEAIKISRSHVLLDGQNRLTALSLQREDLRLEFLVVTDLDDDVQVTMDQGEKRRLEQQMGLADMDSNKTVAAALRLHWLWENDMLFVDNRITKRYTTTPAMVDYAKNHPVLLEQLRHAMAYRRIPVRESLVLAAYAMVCEKYHRDAADEFFQALLDGHNLSEGSPILALRNRLQRIATERIRLSTVTLLGYVITAFNAWAAGRPLQKVQRPRDGAWTQENFPTIKKPKPGEVVW